jgi:Mn-dependent DtxR family transcriptional regulator
LKNPPRQTFKKAILHLQNGSNCDTLIKHVPQSHLKGGSAVRLQESGEMYLETIFVLSKKHSTVRAIDVGEYMGYSKPSVSRAMGLLREGGLITVDRDGAISLTEDGKIAAEKIYERHTILTEFLTRLGVDRETAAEDACKMEHVISDQSLLAIKKFVAE